MDRQEVERYVQAVDRNLAMPAEGGVLLLLFVTTGWVRSARGRGG